MCKDDAKLRLSPMKLDTARSPDSPRSKPPEWETVEGQRKYPLVNGFVYPRKMGKLFTISSICFGFFLCDIILLALFIVLTIIRRFLQITGLLKEREFRSGEVGPAKDVSDKRVCIVGGGSSALAAGKECLENGLEFHAYDSGPCLGGLYACWAYENGQLTTSNFFTAYGSFPCSENDLPCRTTPFKEYVDYLNRFAEHFKLRPFLHYNTEVVKIEDRKDGKWDVIIKKKGSDKEIKETFTNVIIATGINRFPNIPQICGQEKFKGRIMHSSDYRKPTDFEGKKLLVVGMGESASDICLEIAPKAKNMLITTRNGPGAVLTRYHAMMPNDIETSISYHCMPRKMWINPQARGKDNNSLPFWWRVKIWIEKGFNIKEDDEEICNCGDVDYTRYHWMARSGTKTTGFIRACTRHGAKYKEVEVSCFEENGVQLSDGTKFEADIVMFCTGFKRDMSILPEDLQTVHYRNDLWRKTIHPKYGDRIAFVGFARPALGAIPPIAELSSRYAALVMAGRMQLHSVEQMEKDMCEDRSYDEWLYPYDAKRLPGITSYYQSFAQWSNELGSQIRWGKTLLTDPLLFHRLLFSQIIPAQTRIFGHGSDYKQARKAIWLTGMVPVHVQMTKSFLLLASCCAAQLGLTYSPYGLNLK